MQTRPANVIPLRDYKSLTGYRWGDKDPILDLINDLIDRSASRSSLSSTPSGTRWGCSR